MYALSVKDLRQKFPFVKSELKKGTSFLIIYQSKPIAELKPINAENGNIKLSKDFILEDVEKAAAEEWLKLPPLTKEEDDYYMSLKP